MPIQTATILDDQAEPVAIQPPSQLALDCITETLEALRSEVQALVGFTESGDEYKTTGSIFMSSVAAALYHALPQQSKSSRDRSTTWKVISAVGRSNITIHCDHGKDCPDLPQDEQP